MKRWCEPGSNTTQCLRGPTKAQWYTDKHGTFSTLTQTTPLHFSFSYSNGSQSKTLKGEVLSIYWSMFVICHPTVSLKHHTNPSILQSQPQAVHHRPPSIHARHDKACPCDNSPLTLLLLQIVSVTLTFKAFLKNDCITRMSETSRLFSLKLATQIVWKAQPTIRHHSLGNFDVDLLISKRGNVMNGKTC